MLQRLCLRDFVIVRRAEIDFNDGFGVLSGETGAGKSVLIGALSLLAGERAGSERIRPSAESAEIEAVFSLRGNAAAQQWLADNALLGDDDEEGDTLLVRRVIAGAGRKSAAFVNGRQTPLAQMAEIVSLLMDICGQHAHYSLRHVAAHRQLLDTFGDTAPDAVAVAFRQWRTAQAAWQATWETVGSDNNRRMQLEEELAELAALDFSDEKWRRMNAQLTRTTYLSDLSEGCAQLLVLLDGEAGAQASLSEARRVAAMMSRHDDGLSDSTATINDAADLLNEVSLRIQAYAETLHVDDEQQQLAEAFIVECHRLARKYALPDAARLADLYADKYGEWEALPSPQDVEALQQAAAAARQRLEVCCAALSDARRRAAEALSEGVNALLGDLAMPKARLSVLLSPLDEPTALGMESVVLQIRTRADMPFRPLGDVASGGELSRLGLAIQMVAGQAQTKAVAVFDEVDAGIGGATADVVGALLRQLGRNRQVLCVTHLPQVAAYADSHWRVGGEELAVEALLSEARVEELARMQSGARITETARRHAAELLTQAQAALP